MTHNAILKVAGFILPMVFSACLAQCQVLFSDDFESYASGSSLSGQGGWTGGDLRIGDSTVLGSRVLDGFQSTGTPGSATLSHLLTRPLDPGEVTRFSLAVHTFPFPQTSSGGVVLNSLGWIIQFEQVPEWFYQGPNNYERLFLDALNTTATFGLVVDGPAAQVYGFRDRGNGNILFTSPQTIDAQMISTLDHVSITMLPANGFQVDNLRVEVVPEPSVWFLLASGLLYWFLRNHAGRRGPGVAPAFGSQPV